MKIEKNVETSLHKFLTSSLHA